ncbi:MAG: 50S ribosomal protein L9 [Candidatus Neomarinimicrobiota bacterium]
MDVILLDDLESVGSAGDIVNVKPGYARNYLFPRSLAVRASKRNLALAAEKKRSALLKSQRETKVLDKLMSVLKKTEITIEVQAGGEERLFGSVTTGDIQTALAAKSLTIKKQDILLEEPIKALGIYHVPIRIAAGYNQDVKLYVIKA